MLLAEFHGHPVAILRGRVHGYEGYRLREVAFPVRVLKAIGVETLVLTNAAGGLNPAYRAGSLVLVTDHINLTGDNPLIGPNDDELGERFPDMSEPYDRGLIALAERAAAELKIPVEKGVFVAVMGPNLETAAEYRFLRLIGADVVGMSLVAEDIAAVHGRQKVLAVSVVTDMCLPDELKPASIPEILRVAGEAAPRVMALVGAVLERL
jgi:purine-nucleoside phosphorylase